MDFKEFLQTQLNTEQKKAVEHKSGSLLVVAGAGSGKTRVITARITHLITNHNVEPSAIVALTFTNKAAQEMKERIELFLEKENKQLPFIGTFHSYCLLLLKKNQHLLENPFFSILDQDDRTKLLTSIIKRSNLQKQITPKSVGYQISHIKNHSIDPNAQEFYRDNRMLVDLYHAYEKEKKLSKCLDFDDLLLEGLKLFEKNKGFKEQFQETVKHILVDEYQDTNAVQHALLKQMGKQDKKVVADSVCVVGDEDQSIYSWRGATVANIMNFKKDFPKTTVITIEQNYRSVQPILTVANKVITHNTERNPKKLWSDKKGINRVRALSCLSEYQEAQAITQLLKVIDSQKKQTSTAILYRTHFQSRAIEEALIKYNIPYKIIGGINFYERKEIKDVLAYLRLIVNPFDRTSLLRIINTPTRGLGPAVEELIHTTWKDEPFLNFKDVLTKLIDQKKVTGKKAATLQSFVLFFHDIDTQNEPYQAVEHFIIKTRYLSYLKDSCDTQEAATRIDNVNELLNAIKHFATQGIKTIEQFLDQVALMQEHKTKQKSERDPVLMMTLHAAKGLEFDTVIIAGLEDGLLPSSRSLEEVSKIEEERRLFYVGITRAKERLLLTRARYRYTYGQMVDQLPSRFLKEVPSSIVNEYDASQQNETQHRLFFADWLGVKTQSSPVYTFGSPPAFTRSTTNTKKNSPVRATKKFGAAAFNGPFKRAQEKLKHTSSYKQVSPARFKNSALTKKPFASTGLKETGVAQAGGWKKNQPVKHQKFGVGVIQNIEKKSETIYLTINFRVGKKKISSKFVQKV